jgi:sensor histidine kinase YesM
MPIRRRLFLINKQFQLRFAFYVCSWIIALSLAYPLIISTLFDSFIRYLALDPLGPALTHLEKSREEFLSLLAIMQVVLVAVTFFLSIFLSHKIAGPLYKLKRYFQEARDGNIKQKLSFRKRDYFLELVPEYNAMMEAIDKRITRKAEGIQKAIPRIENAISKATPELKRELEAILKLLREAEKSE